MRNGAILLLRMRLDSWEGMEISLFGDEESDYCEKVWLLFFADWCAQ